MKWFRHMADTWEDEKVAKLVRTGGTDGLACYGLWWRVLEIVAKQLDSKSQKDSVTYDVTRWSLLLSVRGSHVRKWMERLALTGLVTVRWNATDLTVTIPNLLKYRDEYTKKSGHHPETVPPTTDAEEQEQHNTPEKQQAGAVDPPIIVPAGISVESFRTFKELYESSGKPMNELDWRAASQEMASQSDLDEHAMVGKVLPFLRGSLLVFADRAARDSTLQTIPLPVNWLKAKPWTRVAKNVSNGSGGGVHYPPPPKYEKPADWKEDDDANY